jgi:hypothetical protein
MENNSYDFSKIHPAFICNKESNKDIFKIHPASIDLIYYNKYIKYKKKYNILIKKQMPN